jgi:hypothetical protein
MFKIRRFSRKKLGWWFKNRSKIDFDPDFQRTARVWKERDKIFLIDSILNGFDIPKIYVADFTKRNIPSLNKRNKDYAVIDGKQRLTAICAFFDNRLPLPRKFFLPAHPSVDLGKLRFRDLKANHPDVARLIENYVLDVKVIETDDRRLISDVFLRLNKASRALNGAEIRNAMIGKAVNAIRDIAKHAFFVRRIRFATDRSQERNAAAKILLLEYMSGPAETKKRNLDQFVRDIGETSSGRFQGTLNRVDANMKVLLNVFRNQDHLLSAQGSAPLYYLFISRLKPADRKKARDFLEHFEDQRTRNRGRPNNIRDGAFDTFDFTSRSTNDKTSYDARLKVLRDKFATWKRHQSTKKKGS